MKSVVICGSRRFKKEIRQFVSGLREVGVVVFEPMLYEPSEEDKKNSEEVKYLRWCGVTLNHFSKIRKAEVCFVYNKDGYIGVSTTLEMGFCAGRDMPIYALEADRADPPRGILIDQVVATPEDLLKKL